MAKELEENKLNKTCRGYIMDCKCFAVGSISEWPSIHKFLDNTDFPVLILWYDIIYILNLELSMRKAVLYGFNLLLTIYFVQANSFLSIFSQFILV